MILFKGLQLCLNNKIKYKYVLCNVIILFCFMLNPVLYFKCVKFKILYNIIDI